MVIMSPYYNLQRDPGRCAVAGLTMEVRLDAGPEHRRTSRRKEVGVMKNKLNKVAHAAIGGAVGAGVGALFGGPIGAIIGAALASYIGHDHWR